MAEIRVQRYRRGPTPASSASSQPSSRGTATRSLSIQPQAKQWARKVIDTSLTDGHTIQTADLNRDGNDEIVAGFRGAPHSVYLYSGSGIEWSRSTLDDGGMGAAACAVGDLDGDSRPDIACIDGTRLKWYQNTGAASATLPMRH